MSPKVIAILVIILLVIFGGMALTMKRSADKRRERTADYTGADPISPEKQGLAPVDHSISRCFIA